MDNLLPRAEHWLSIRHRHCERWPQHGCLQVRVPITVVPGLLVTIIAAGRNEFVENARQVALQSRLEFNCPHGSSAADIEHVHSAGSNTRCSSEACDLLGQILHVAVSARVDSHVLLKCHVLPSTDKSIVAILILPNIQR